MTKFERVRRKAEKKTSANAISSEGNPAIAQRNQNIAKNNEFLRNLLEREPLSMNAEPKSTGNQRERMTKPEVVPSRKSERNSNHKIQSDNAKERKLPEYRICRYCQYFATFSEFRAKLYGTNPSYAYLEKHQKGSKCAKRRMTIMEINQVNEQFYQERDQTTHIYDTIDVSQSSVVNRNVFDNQIDEQKSNEDNLSRYDTFDESPDVFFEEFLRTNLTADEEFQQISNIVEMEELNHIDNVGGLNRETRYLQFQRSIYDISYGIKCLEARNFEDMSRIMRTTYSNKFKDKFLSNIKIYCHWIKHECSRSERQAFLDLVHDLMPNSSDDAVNSTSTRIPRSVTGITNQIELMLKPIMKRILPISISWPEGWHMERYCGRDNLEPVILHLRVPIELISELFINPEIMFKP